MFAWFTHMTPTPGKRDKIFAVVNRKGGVAKTTTAITLAHGLSRKLMRRVDAKDLDKVPNPHDLFQFQERHYLLLGHVLLVDFDAQGHCARGLGVEPGQADLSELLLEKRPLQDVIVSADRAAQGLPRPNLWLLPSSDNLEYAKEVLRYRSLQTENGQSAGFGQLLAHCLGQAVERFYYIILDCPPSLDVFTQAIYQFADAAIVPVKPDYFSMVETDKHLNNLSEAQLNGIPIKIHTIVPTFNVDRQRLDRLLLDELRQTHGKRVSEPIPRSQLIAESPMHKQTIFELDPRFLNPATLAYQQLVDRVYYG